MSALTSPSHSPQALHRIKPRSQSRSRPRTSSPRASPRAYAAVSNKAARTSTSTTSSSVTSTSKQPYKQFEEGGEGAGKAFRGYISRGTQYSPDGLPPTAKLAPSRESPQQVSGSAKKRKETGRSESPQRRSMSAGPSMIPRQPAKPDAQGDAGAYSTLVSNQHASRTSSLPQRSAAPSEPELEEARSTHGHSSAPKRSRPDPATVKQMPREYWTCNPKDLGVLISNMLTELIRLNDRIPLRDGRLTRFHSRAPPGISVQDYLQRLIQHATLSPPILLSMVYYIDRLCALYTPFTINSLTVHRFLITAATVAAKGLSDSFWTNPTYARIGGIPVTELATLELEFLQKVQWKIVPRPELLEDYYKSLVDRTDGFELESGSSAGSSLVESEGTEGGGDDEDMETEPA